MTKKNRIINEIIYHCSANQAGCSFGAKEIRAYHIAPPPQGRGWADIGYHFVIKQNGSIEYGRNIEIAGAHCLNHNAYSIGICLVGGIDKYGNPEDNFTKEQFESLNKLTRGLIAIYPDVKIYGHCEFANKACPVFDVKNFLELYNLSRYKG